MKTKCDGISPEEVISKFSYPLDPAQIMDKFMAGDDPETIAVVLQEMLLGYGKYCPDYYECYRHVLDAIRRTVKRERKKCIL